MSIEELLRAELRDVADGVDVPRMPSLDGEPGGLAPRWPSLVAAAVIALILAGGAHLVLRDRDGSPEPAPRPTPSVTPTPPAEDVPPTRPSGGVVFTGAGGLAVDGEQVEGNWQMVAQQGPVWVATLTDFGELWWGRGTTRYRLGDPTDATYPTSVVISPDARLLAWGATDSRGTETVHLVETSTGEERALLTVADRGAAHGPVAVTDNGIVVFEHCVTPATEDGGWSSCTEARLDFWVPDGGVTGTLPLPARRLPADGVPVLARMVIPSGADDGLLIQERRYARPEYVRIDDGGRVETVATLPPRAVAVSADEESVLIQGECAGPLCPWEVEPFGGGERVEIRPPADWSFVPASATPVMFAPRGYIVYGDARFVLLHTVEDGGFVVLNVAHADGPAARRARCSLTQAVCVLVEPN